MILFLLACTPDPKLDDSAVSPDDSDAPVDSSPDSEQSTCETAPLPVEKVYEPGYTSAEDFAFDAEGYLVSIDPLGNLVGINRDGDRRTILPSATGYAAGTRILPGGDILFCDAQKGGLVRVDPATGASRVVLSGLNYPNGMELDAEGQAYVAEQITGTVRKVNPDTGESTVVAYGLYNPNGVSFSTDYQTLYVGSFGAGVVWAIDREGEGWSAPRVYATTPESPGVPPNWCDQAEVGAECPMNGGYGIGECADSGNGSLYCGPGLDYTACDGRSTGDDCTTLRFGETLQQSCTASSASDELFCPATASANTAACKAKVEGDTCSVRGQEGACYGTWEGVVACYVSPDPDPYTAGCQDLALGDACVVDDSHYPSIGTCDDGAVFGLPGIICVPSGLTYDEHGGLDGLNVDSCDNLYVTEYIQGKIWRFSSEGAEPELVVKLSSAWIPNLHWGNGVGGWEKDLLYVMDREDRGIFVLDVGVEGFTERVGW